MSNKSKEPIAFEDTLYERASSASEKEAGVAAAPSSPPAREGGALPVTEPRVYQQPTEFARGGLGRILKAYDTRLGRSVALKELLHKQNNAEPRFLLEARITARLEHPSIIPIYEVGCWPNGDPYYAMRLLSGEPLSQHIQQRPHLRERLSLLPQVIAVCQAIAYAHAKNIIHRDLKPHNVLLGEFGEAIVIDWGLAKELQAPSPAPRVPEEAPLASPAPDSVDLNLTAEGAIMGTPAYMPPEQARGGEVDARADIYSLGAIMYHLVTGQPPYAGIKTKSVVLLVQSQAPAELSALQPEAPGPLRSIIERAMARDPAQRYQSALALADDLARFQAGGQVSAHSYSGLERLSRAFDRHKNLVMLSGLSLLLVFFVGVFSLVKIYQANQSEASARVEAEQERDKANTARSLAEVQRDLLRRNAHALLVEQGRSELSSNGYQRALPLLSAAYQEATAHEGEPALRFLLSEALQQTETRRASFTGHDKPASSLGFSPDESLFFSAASDQRVLLWDTLSASRLKELRGYAAAFLTDDELLLAVNDNGTQHLELRRVKSGALVSSWPIPPDTTTIMTSPDGQYVATRSEDGFSLLKSRTGEALAAPRALPQRLAALRLTNTHAFLLSADGRFYAWELGAGVVKQSALGMPSVMIAAISPDGSRVAAYSYDGVGVLWEVASQRGATISASEQLSCLSFSPDSARLAVGNGRSILIYEGGQSLTIDAHAATVTSLTFSPDSKSLASTSLDNTARRWDARTGLLLQTFSGHSQPVLSAYFSPSQRTLLTTSRDRVVSQWDITSAALSVALPGQKGRINTLQFSLGGDLLMFGGFAQRFSIVDATMQQLFVESSAAYITCQGYSPSGEQLLTIDSVGAAILWDAATQERRQALQIQRALALSFFSEEAFATVNEDGSVSFWDTKSGALLSSVAGQGKPLRAVASSRGGWFALIMPRQIQLFSLKERAFSRVIEAPGSSSLATVAFSSQEDRLLVLGFGGGADVFDLEKQRWVASLSLGAQSFISAVYSPDGSLIATTSVGGTLALWDAQRNVLLASRPSASYLDGAVMAFSPDSSLLVSTTASSALLFWRISRETRSSEEIDVLTKKLSPWRFEGGNLVLQ